MIININKKLTGDPTPGPVATLHPRRSLSPSSQWRPSPDTHGYSGVLECPCTSRKVKMVEKYLLGAEEACPEVVIGATSVPSAANTLAECQHAAALLCPNTTAPEVTEVQSE